MTMVPARRVVEVARSFVDFRFRHQGREIPPHPLPGLDCVGVVAKTAHVLGISEFDWTNYQRKATWSDEFKRIFDENMRAISRQEIQPGVVVIFKQEQFPCHCGIIASRPGRGLSLIHAYLPRKKVVEEDFAGEWADPSVFLGAYAYYGVNYG